jgi:hypothetical protein
LKAYDQIAEVSSVFAQVLIGRVFRGAKEASIRTFWVMGSDFMINGFSFDKQHASIGVKRLRHIRRNAFAMEVEVVSYGII